MSIGKWFEQAGKDIGKFVTKEVPVFFTKTIPSVGKAETYRPSLIPLRKKSEQLRQKLATERTLFFDEKARLAETTTRYRTMSEDYARRMGESAAKTKIKVIKDARWDDAANAAQKTIQDVDESVRTVLGTVTFGLSEPLWAVAVAVRAKEEMDFLEKRNGTFGKVIKRIREARSQMKKARSELDVSIKEFGKTSASLCELAEERNQANPDTAREDAVVTMARRLIADGLPADQVEMLTGLTAQKITELATASKKDTVRS